MKKLLLLMSLLCLCAGMTSGRTQLAASSIGQPSGAAEFIENRNSPLEGWQTQSDGVD